MTAVESRPLSAVPDENGQRQPPHDAQAERAVLGACLQDPRVIPDVATILQAGDFYRPAHEAIWTTLHHRHSNDQPLDVLSVAQALHNDRSVQSAGGPVYLSDLASDPNVLPAQATWHARIVTARADERRRVETGTWLIQAGYSGLDRDDVDSRLVDYLATRPAGEPHTADPRLILGGSFLFDGPDTTEAIWGHGDDVLWARGESLIVGGPSGVGKTTIVQQLALASIGVGNDQFLGMPVQQVDRVLYLASDRPSQARKSLRRMVTENDRDQLDQRLTVWRGPPENDVAKNTHLLLEMAHQAKAQVLVLDSLKDMAIGLADDEVGAGLNQALQRCLAAGIEIVGIHHPRKTAQGARKEPESLDEFYGSTWITAGAGSVLSLWGSAGDAIVSMRHLKQPSGEVGPWRLRHDHDKGHTDIFHGVDVYRAIQQTGIHGMSATALATLLFPRTDGKAPTDNEKARARRRLEKLENDGLAVRHDPSDGRGGRGIETRWFLADRYTTGEPE